MLIASDNMPNYGVNIFFYTFNVQFVAVDVYCLHFLCFLMYASVIHIRLLNDFLLSSSKHLGSID